MAVLLCALLSGAAAAQSPPPPGCRDGVPVSERVTDYACAGGTRALVSDGAPRHWWDGTRWRDPDPTWRGGELRGIPGAVIWRRDATGLTATSRTGEAIGALGWRGDAQGDTYAFRWDGLDCALVAQARSQKLICTVLAPLGRRTLRVPVRGDVHLGADGAAVIGGAWRLERLTIVGADGAEYGSAVSAWRAAGGALSVRVDDRALPPSAYPYSLDPTTGPNLPSTCADDSAVGTVTWSTTSGATNNSGNCTGSNCAAASLALNAQSHWLKCTGFGFTDPPLSSDKIIKGIVADVRGQRSGNGATIAITDIRAVKGGTIQSTNVTSTACNAAWTASLATYTCGTSLSTWGTSWAISDIAGSSTFGVALSTKNTGSTTRSAQVDYVQVTIYYSPPSGRAFVTGWDSQSAEDGVAVGGPTYVAGAARTGSSGLRISAAANGVQTWTTPTAIDGDLTDRAFARWYWTTTPDLPVNSAVVVATINEASRVGCYLKLSRDTEGCYSYQTLYHGGEPVDRDFGTFAATTDPALTCVTSLAGRAVMLGQQVGAGTIACPLRIDGRDAQSFAVSLSSDCSGTTCDIAGVRLGSPATGSVGDYAAFPAYTLNIDDFVVDNLAPPGVGYARALYPSSDTGATLGWSNTCGGSAWNCLDDWAGGGTVDTCSNSSDTRQKSSGTGTDLLDPANISPALSASESIAAVRGLAACCTTNASNPEGLSLHFKSSTSDYVTPEFSVGTTAPKMLSWTLSNNFTSGDPAWTEATANAMLLGYDRSTPGSSSARCSATMVYVDVTTPTLAVDRNLQDWNGDGLITVVTGCDSMTAGTKASTCIGAASCTASCTSDADCSGGLCQQNGKCAMGCEVNSDCTCGTGAVCGTAFNWVNQFSLKVPQVDTLINCGRNAMPSQWWQAVLPAIIANPVSHAPPCRLIRGAWGHCSATTTQDCAAAVDCPPGQSCVPHVADYVIDMCGGNEVIGYGPDDCSAVSNILGVRIPTGSDRWGTQACPRAVATPTAAFEVARKTCSTDADCTGDANYGSLSRCKGYCSGHQSPLWSCDYDDQCPECSANSARKCFHVGLCVANGAYVLQGGNYLAPHYKTCNSDADCSAGTCVSYEEQFGTYDEAYGTCGDCIARACVTNSTKYCTPTCASITCSTDADCAPAGVLGGVCDTGPGRCKACGSGLSYNIDASPAVQALDARRVAQSLGGLTADALAARDAAITTTVRTAGAQRIALPYARAFMLGSDEGIKNVFTTLALSKLRTSPLTVDTHFASRYDDDRIAGGTVGAILLPDGVHNAVGGAAITSRYIAASANALYPVCSNSSATLCGACDVSCTADIECNKPVIGASPTPTPKAGACRTATPGVKVCGCSTNSDCAAGCTCQNIKSGGGTDNRCICEALSSCPLGDNTRARARKAASAVCSSPGTCTEERVPPLCTQTKTRCATTADCLGYIRGDVCAADGVWQACQVNADCTRDGGIAAKPVCAPGTPVAGTSPTPLSRVCQQPTPTP